MMMADIDKRSDLSDELRREAQQLLLRLHSGQVSPEDIDAVRHWRAVSPTHRQAFAEAALRWDVASAAARNLARSRDVETLYREALSAKRQQLTRRAVIGGVGIAAVASGAAYGVIHPPLGLWPSLSEFLADYRTDTGEQRRITLADNVSVEMNTRTSLVVGTVPARTRQIELVAGEIVVTAAAMTFTVNAGGGQASAARATFDLRRDGSRISVACLSGNVEVRCRGGTAELQALQTVVYDEQALSGVGSVDPGAIEAWRRGLLVFENQPLSEVIDEINRYRRGRIILLNTELARLPLDATFRLDRIDEAVPKIAHVFGAKVRALPGGIVFLS